MSAREAAAIEALKDVVRDMLHQFVPYSNETRYKILAKLNAIEGVTQAPEVYALVDALTKARDILFPVVDTDGAVPCTDLIEVIKNTFEHIEDTLAPYIQEVTHGGGAVESSGNGV